MKTSALIVCVIFATACSSGQTAATAPETSATVDTAAAPSAAAHDPVSPPPTTSVVPVAPPPTSSAVVTAQPPQATAPDADRGAKLFADNSCGGCHGTKAKPGKKNVFVMKWNDDEKVKATEIIKKGKSPMPGFDDKLSDAQVADLIAFVSTK